MMVIAGAAIRGGSHSEGGKPQPERPGRAFSYFTDKERKLRVGQRKGKSGRKPKRRKRGKG
jgi:hypothetical protein